MCRPWRLNDESQSCPDRASMGRGLGDHRRRLEGSFTQVVVSVLGGTPVSFISVDRGPGVWPAEFRLRR